MKLNPLILKNWQIAEAAEPRLVPIDRLAAGLGLKPDEWAPMGRLVGKIDAARVLARHPEARRGRYIDVTAITPTPLGEGKTTVTLGLIQGLARLGKRVTGAIRQPSAGPTFNVKGAGAGGGRAQCLPLTALSIRLTGDLDAVTNAHNLAMVALTARLAHESRYGDAQLAAKRLRRLDIDPGRVDLRWAMDFCAQALRRIAIGQGGPRDGVPMESGFQITASSEVMAILAMCRDFRDLRARLARMAVARTRQGCPVTTRDLEVDGAMAAWLTEAVNPNLLQTLEGQPVFVHAGPFANIALGQSSVLADRLGVRLAEYHVTESGFGADIGYEKFWNIKCRLSGLKPDAVVLVCTVRALKMHGGGPAVRPGVPLDEAYRREAVGLVEAGCENLAAHIGIVRQSGVRPVVCINGFSTDTPAELDRIARCAERCGARAVVSRHWLKGGEGARELAEAVVAACGEPKRFRYLYSASLPMRERIERVARSVYGADGVSISEPARRKLRDAERDPALAGLPVCMAKTHLSLSHDPALKGRPRGWTLPIRDLLIYRGAELAVPVAGDIAWMPGTASDPAFRRIDVDSRTGRVRGLA